NLSDNNVFWTEANGGSFVSLENAYFSEENDFNIADILAKHESQNQKGRPTTKYQPINSALVHKLLQENNNILKCIQQESFGILGDEQNYYFANDKYQDLFPKSGPSCFVYDLDEELNKIFESKGFSKMMNIKEPDTPDVLDLLVEELPNEQEIYWDPSSQDVPNRQWLNSILKKLKWGIGLEIPRLSQYPLLPVISPNDKLVRIDPLGPLRSSIDLSRQSG
ncbi:10948_t:CDS:2, partial [Scutellospora calospora]